MMPMIAAACAAISAWLSLGAVAVVSNSSQSGLRVGLLPPLWLLIVLICASLATARIFRLSRAVAAPLLFALVLWLPWIPGWTPAAFLMWTGRIAAGVWISIALAMLIVTGRVRFDWLRNPARAPRIAAVLACVLYVASARNLAGVLPGGDEPHYLIITQSLLKDHDLQIENNHARGDYAAYFRGRLSPDYLRRGANGQIYSIHAPGLPAVIAPAFAVAGYHGVVLFLAIVAAIGSALLWTMAYGLTGNLGGAWFAWATWALTVPFFFQAFSVFPDGFGATVVLLAARPLTRKTGLPNTSSADRSYVLSGAALALLPWLHTRFAIIAVALGLFIALRLVSTREGLRQLVPFLAIPVVTAVAWFAFFRTIYGTFSPAAPYGDYTQTAVTNIFTGLPGLFFDQQFGILPNAPVYGFCLAGLISLAVRRPRLAIELAATALVYLLSSSAYHMWWGGSSAPARFAVPVLPLLVLPAAWIWDSARAPATRAVGLMLLFMSVAITSVMVTVDGGQLAYNFRDGYSRVAEWLSSSVDLPAALPSFFRQTPAAATATAAIWLMCVAAGWAGLGRLTRNRRDLALRVLVTVAIVAMIASTLAWRVRGAQGATAELSQIELLQQFDPRWRPHGVDLTHLRSVPMEQIEAQVSISTPLSRPPAADGTLLLVPGVLPAGTYVLEAPNAPLTGTANLVIGRNARPIASWTLNDVRDNRAQFDLPVNVGSIVVLGDQHGIRAPLSVRPIRITPPAARPTQDYARRADRFGPGIVYFFDDGAFVESAGFWVRAAAGTRIATAAMNRDVVAKLFLRNAAVPNHVTLKYDGHTQALDLAPREEKLLSDVVPPAGAVLIDIASDSGFRPSDVEPGSTDTRYLGVWVELRQ